MILQASPLWFGIPLSDWADIGTVAAAVIGIIAAVIAAVAIIQARRLQKAASEPYIAVMLEPNEHLHEMAELVIKNYGSTAAHGVKVTFTPPALRVDLDNPGKARSLKVPSPIPTLVPGQEWRTTWDLGKEHKKANLDAQYKAKVEYKGLRWRKHRDDFVLDWSIFYDHTYLQINTIHHAAKKLHEIRELLGRGQSKEGPFTIQLKPSPEEEGDVAAEDALLQEKGQPFLERQKREGPWPEL